MSHFGLESAVLISFIFPCPSCALDLDNTLWVIFDFRGLLARKIWGNLLEKLIGLTTRKETDKGALVSVRRFLENAGVML